MAIWLDTNFNLNLINPKVPFAEKEKILLNELLDGPHGLMYTTNLVVSETCTLVRIKTHNNIKA